MEPAFPTPTPPVAPAPLDGAGTWLPILFMVVGAIVLVGFVIVIVGIVRRNTRLRDVGHDPETVESDIAAGTTTGTPTTPDASVEMAAGDTVEERLAQVDDLHVRGVIDETEHAATRARILGDA